MDIEETAHGVEEVRALAQVALTTGRKLNVKFVGDHRARVVTVVVDAIDGEIIRATRSQLVGAGRVEVQTAGIPIERVAEAFLGPDPHPAPFQVIGRLEVVL